MKYSWHAVYCVNVVHRLKGKCQNISIVGTYSLLTENEKQVSKLTTHQRKLAINGKIVERSWMSGNHLHWEGLSADESEYSGLPTNGFAEFSSGGQVIKHSSFDARGVRELADEQTMVACSSRTY